ncbi:MAG TPA: GNAT family N-acetyltransferase, partial [Candidatus Caenarcaniphilales bacterium]|nr:GNAT family N-acetyltransferase [Candidatus Caenarcaniphilales bacterium]
MTIEVRHVPIGRLREWIEAVETAFGEEVREAHWADLQRILEPERVLGAFDGERIVGGGAAFSFRLTVPGGRAVPAGGVTAVGVMPTHRRRGILTQLMRTQLADIRRRGEPVAILWASEGSIYQRYGYGLASANGSFEIDRERTAFREATPRTGEMRLVSRDEAARLFPLVYEVVRRATSGFYERSSTWWEVEVLADPEYARRGASRKFYALHERDGRPAAYAIYRIRPDWGEGVTKSTLAVDELMAVDAAATREMWRYVFGVDLIAWITVRLGPADHPLLLMLAEPRRFGLRVRDGLWLRILDVPAALAGRGYAADGSIVLQVDDAFLPQLGGRWRLSVADGRASVETTEEAAELAVETTDLAATYLGGFTFG